MIKRFKINQQKSWVTHRAGWKYVLQYMHDLHNPVGVLFNGVLDDAIHKKKFFKEYWTGFFHHPPHHPAHIQALDMDKMLKTKVFLDSKHLCRGIFVLSEYLKNFIESKVKIPVVSIKHPTLFVDNVFTYEKYTNNTNKKLVTVGHWLRRYTNFCKLPYSYEKFILNAFHSISNVTKILKDQNVDLQDIKIMCNLNDLAYDDLLSKNIVFLDLYDSSANNAIVECIVRNTPMLINKIPPVVEYLGEKYPFYFECFDEACYKINQEPLIEQTYLYLKNMDKSEFKVENFIQSIVNSDIYQNLPINRIFL